MCLPDIIHERTRYSSQHKAFAGTPLLCFSLYARQRQVGSLEIIDHNFISHSCYRRSPFRLSQPASSDHFSAICIRSIDTVDCTILFAFDWTSKSGSHAANPSTFYRVRSLLPTMSDAKRTTFDTTCHVHTAHLKTIH